MKKLLKLYDEGCTKCKLHQAAVQVCQEGVGNPKANIMIVGRMPNSDAYQDRLEADLVEAGFEPQDLFFSAAIKCRNFEQNISTADVKACRSYLEQEIALIKPKWILALGNEALVSTTGHSGIMKYRGKPIDKGDYKVFPTISPASVMRNPGQRQGYIADLRLCLAEILEKSAKVPTPSILVVQDKQELKKLSKLLKTAELISYDIETTGRDEFDPEGRIVSIAGTLRQPNGQLTVFAIPLFHPGSVWLRGWRNLLEFLAALLSKPAKQVAHNGKFDARWLRHFGVPMKVTADTMLMAHILDENRQKGLKPQAASRLGVAPWAINTRDLLTTPIQEVLHYNALDAWYTYHIYQDMRPELIGRPRVARIYQKVIIPANEIYIEAERRGVWMDRERLATRRHQTLKMVEEIECQLQQYIPQGTVEELIALGHPHTKHRVPRLSPINFNPSNWSRWWLFEHLELPVLERGKEKDNGDPGAPSMREAVMMELKSHHPSIATLLRRTNQVKLAQFMESYDALLDENDRIHTTFKLAGTVTGRTSSGKVDEEKITGQAVDRRGINLQQVPRDPFVRGLFGAAPGYIFIEADQSQVELRIVAFLSRDSTMLRLYQTGQDIHRATASTVLGVPISQVSKDDRKKAKAVNFGFVYGMGAPKFVMTAFEKYELVFTLDEAKAIRAAFFAQFSGLLAWHAKQRRLVHKYGRVMSPIGRIRHLPDIRSADKAVQGEAERQAINAPVQSFGSDMMLISMVHIDEQLKKQGLDAHVLGTVHDSGLFEVREDQVADVLPIIKRGMEDDLMDILSRRFGVDLDVPIIADLKCGKHWGDAQEIPEDVVFDAKALDRWLRRTELGRVYEN